MRDDDYDEDDEPRPRKKRRSLENLRWGGGGDEVDEDRPRRRRRADEDDDHDEGDRPRRKKKRRGPVTSRVYVHDKCGGVTEVSGDDFTRLADPFSLVTQTYCCTCQGFVNLGQVYWMDTEEPIADYRRRLRREAPPLLVLFRWVLGPLAFALVGLLVALPFAKPNPLGAVLAGLVCGLLVGGFVSPWLTRLLWKIDYRLER
jgi:hypothetical protein